MAVSAAAAIGLAYVLGTARHQIFSGDPAFYIGLARSIAAGRGYVFNSEPHTLYPPGFPALLAPVADSIPLAQVYVALWGLAGVAAVSVYLHARGEPAVRVLAPLLAVSVPYYAIATRGMRSEAAYVAISFAALALAERPRGRLHYATLGLFGAAAVTIRTIGVVLPGSFLVAALFAEGKGRERRRLFTAGMPGLCAFALWGAWTARHEGESYFDQVRRLDPHNPDAGSAAISDILWRTTDNIRIQATHTTELLTNVTWLKPLWLSPFVVVTAALVSVGIIRELRRNNGVTGWYALSYIGAVLVWPYDEGKRFLLPILPIIALLVWHGGQTVVTWMLRRRANRHLLALGFASLLLSAALAYTLEGTPQDILAIVAWAVLLATIFFIRQLGRLVLVLYAGGYVLLGAVGIAHAANENLHGPASQPSREIAGAIPWIISNTGESATIVADQASGIHLHTGRRAVQFPVTAEVNTLAAVLQSAQYLLVTRPPSNPYYRPTGPERLGRIFAHTSIVLKLVHVYDGGWLYEVVCDSDCARESAR